MNPDHGLDRLLDRSVLLGYSSIGYAIRRRSWPANDPRPGSLAGQRALVTGARGGLGESAALGLARLGATVHLLVRSAATAQSTVDRISAALAKESLPVDLHLESCDVSDLAAVRAFADQFVSEREEAGEALDILIHNAGVMPPERTESIDGHELSVATHVLGPVLLTERLLPVLGRSTNGARVVFVTSGGMYTQVLPADDPDFTRGDYKGAVAYARSKRMQVDLAPVLDQRWSGDNVSVYTMHPGWVATPGVSTSMPLFGSVMRPILRTPTDGSDTAVWLAATEPAMDSGTFWHDRQQRPTNYRKATKSTPAQVDATWRWVEGAAGLA